MAQIERGLWGSDVPVSAPVIPKRNPQTIRVPMQGFGFEPTGLVFDLDEATWAEIYLPTRGPEHNS